MFEALTHRRSKGLWSFGRGPTGGQIFEPGTHLPFWQPIQFPICSEMGFWIHPAATGQGPVEVSFSCRSLAHVRVGAQSVRVGPASLRSFARPRREDKTSRWPSGEPAGRPSNGAGEFWDAKGNRRRPVLGSHVGWAPVNSPPMSETYFSGWMECSLVRFWDITHGHMGRAIVAQTHAGIGS